MAAAPKIETLLKVAVLDEEDSTTSTVFATALANLHRAYLQLVSR
jgi:hypothetical protein